MIVKAVGNAVKKHRRKKAKKDITDVPFVDTELNIEETSTAPAEVSREKLGLFDKRIYDGLFRPLIRERGEAYCSDGKIRDLKKRGLIIPALQKVPPTITLSFHSETTTK